MLSKEMVVTEDRELKVTPEVISNLKKKEKTIRVDVIMKEIQEGEIQIFTWIKTLKDLNIKIKIIHHIQGKYSLKKMKQNHIELCFGKNFIFRH